MDVKLALLILAVVITQVCGYSLDGAYPRFNRRSTEEKSSFSFVSSSDDGKGSKAIVVGSIPASLASVLPLRTDKDEDKDPLRFLKFRPSRRSYLRYEDFDPFLF